MGNTMVFKVPFVIYADFEAIVQGSEEETNPLNSYTRDINHHVPSRFCTYTFAYGKVKDSLRLYRGKDCVEVFCNHIKKDKCPYHMFPPKTDETSNARTMERVL